MIKIRCGSNKEKWSTCKYWNDFINTHKFSWYMKSPENCLYYNDEKCPKVLEIVVQNNQGNIN